MFSGGALAWADRGEPDAPRIRTKTIPVESLEQAVERLIQSAVDQGFPRIVSDPVMMARIAGILEDAPAANARRPRRRKALRE